MKPMDLLEAIGSIRDKYILDAHSKQSAPKKVLPFRKVFLVAAVIAMLLLLILGGCADAMSKVFQVLGTEALSDQFLLFTYGMAFLLCTCLVILRKEFPGKRELFFGALIGIPNFFSTKTMLAALTDISAVVAYPTFSVSTMLMVTLAGTVFFREKLTKNQWIALGIILVALALLNL